MQAIEVSREMEFMDSPVRDDHLGRSPLTDRLQAATRPRVVLNLLIDGTQGRRCARAHTSGPA
jgi:hypothetical protein